MNSELLSQPQFGPLLKDIAKSRNQIKDKRLTLYTIGYEGKSIEQYLSALMDNSVSVLIDVRHNPFSRKWGFAQKQLQDITEKCGIDYVHFPQLGIEGSLRNNIISRSDYNKLFNRYRKSLGQVDKEEALQNIWAILRKNKRVALTCFEKDYHCCHRHLVAEAVMEQHKIKTKHL